MNNNVLGFPEGFKFCVVDFNIESKEQYLKSNEIDERTNWI